MSNNNRIFMYVQDVHISWRQIEPANESKFHSQPSDLATSINAGLLRRELDQSEAAQPKCPEC